MGSDAITCFRFSQHIGDLPDETQLYFMNFLDLVDLFLQLQLSLVNILQIVF